MKQTLSLVFVLALLGLIALAYWINRVAADAALTEIFGALFAGIKILFFTALVLGAAWVPIELHKRSKITIISGTKHRPAQAVVHKGELVQLAQPGQAQLDPMQQLAMLKTVLQLQGQMGKLAQQTTVQEVAPREIEAPKESIPAIVHYEDIRDEVPDDMSLLGVHPSDGNLELTDWEKLKMLWVIGSSSTGKSNTVYGKALEARNHHALLAVIDQHINKPDSLAKKLAPLSDAYVRPVAVSDEQVIATLKWFKHEFQARVDDTTGTRQAQKIVLIMDEMNRMARSTNAELVALLKEVVAIGGEESRGFGMYVWAISQKAVHLKWLRDSAITVIAHRVTRMEEALLACNDDRKAAQRLLKFQIGRCFVYGVDFEDLLELQQPLYEVPDESVIESTIESTEASTTEEVESISSSSGPRVTPVTEPMDRTLPFDMEKFRQAQKMLLARETQNKIICEVWKVQENTRQFRIAKEEFQLMLAYLASMASVEEE